MLVSILFVIIPIIIFSGYAVISYKELPFEYDIKLIRRIYYIILVIWIYTFILVYRDTIERLTILKVNVPSQKSLNIILFTFALFTCGIIWDYIFISCKTLKSLKLKDTEFTIEEANNIKYAEGIQEKEKKALYCVLNAKIKVLKYIDYYLNKDITIEPHEMYLDVINEYQKRRTGVKVYAYYSNDDGRIKMQKKIKLTLEQLGSIAYSIELYGFCKPQELRNNKYIFAKIKTKYIEEDIILVLVSELLIDKEYIILIEIISYFEQKLDIEILKLEIEHIKSN